MANNDLKITLKEHRAILYRFLLFLAAADKISVKNTLVIADVCKFVESIIEDAHKQDMLQNLVTKALEDEDVVDFMQIVDVRHARRNKLRYINKEESIKKLLKSLYELLQE